jgi:ParB-like chromosome segregation protein Spo0J
MSSKSQVDSAFAFSARDKPATEDDPTGEAVGTPYGCLVEVNTLLAGVSPRSGGVDNAHVARLAECAADLPPIVVHRQTMRIIDGMHRLRVAVQEGRELVEVTFFDGSDDEAFMRAVELNVKHGLPLSLSDRKAAARRILVANAAMSNGAVAAKTGLSDKTVAAIRACSGPEIPYPRTRLGRDGRVYPVGYAAEGRARAARLIAERPNASLREIAAAAGVSPGVVSDVRKRVKAGADPAGHDSHVERAPIARTSPPREARTIADRDRLAEDKRAALMRLRSDPSVRDKQAGRELLRWLSTHAIDIGDLPECASAIPAHRAAQVAALARQSADAWRELARRLETIETRCDSREGR